MADETQVAPVEPRSRSHWHARGTGQDAYVEVFCDHCSLLVTFENVTLNATFKHCARQERIPEKCYEQYIELRETIRTSRLPPQQLIRCL